ncbi:MAG: biotin/lipoyl-containing protein [Vicinamibacterales bacterium]
MSRRYRIAEGGADVAVEVTADGVAMVEGQRFHVTSLGDGRYRVTADDGTNTVVAIAGPGHAPWAFAGGRAVELTVDTAPRRPSSARAQGGDMTAPMPATVVRLHVAVGDTVTAGTPVVVLEAMKMELTVRAATDGVVRAVHCAVGDLVTPGVPLVEIAA